jgi:hypothetical protein
MKLLILCCFILFTACATKPPLPITKEPEFINPLKFKEYPENVERSHWSLKDEGNIIYMYYTPEKTRPLPKVETKPKEGK